MVNHGKPQIEMLSHAYNASMIKHILTFFLIGLDSVGTFRSFLGVVFFFFPLSLVLSLG